MILDMGYESQYDTKFEHEGWVAMVFTDGRMSSGSSSSGGHYIEGYTYLPEDPNDTRTWGRIDPACIRPFSDIVAWAPRCECGWVGVAADVEHDGPEKYRDMREPSDMQEQMIMGQWRLHLRDTIPGAYPAPGARVGASA